MCGIGGIFTANNNSVLPQLEALFEAISDRGRHACGFAFRWNNSDSDIVWKKAISSVDAVAQGILTKKIGSNLKYALLHTRYTTQGSTANNGNNHPIVAHDMIVTHNGVINNDDLIFRELGVRRINQVDTECINALLRHDSTKGMIQKIFGSASVAWVDTTQNQQIVNLITNGRNPLVIARMVEGHVVWASNLYHIEDAGFNIKDSFNAIPYKHYQISQGSNEPMIQSEFVSNRREQPRVLGRNSHSASYGDVKPTSSRSRPKSQKNARKATSKGSKGKKFIQAGYVYDEDLKCWRKARITDWS